MLKYSDKVARSFEAEIYKALVRLGKYQSLEIPVLLDSQDRNGFKPQTLQEICKQDISKSDVPTLQSILSQLQQRAEAIQATLPEEAKELVEGRNFSIRNQLNYLALQKVADNLRSCSSEIYLPNGSQAILLKSNNLDLSNLTDLDKVLSKHFANKKFCLEFTVRENKILDRDHETLACVLSSELFKHCTLTLVIEGDCRSNFSGKDRNLKPSTELKRFLERATTLVYRASAMHNHWLTKATSDYPNIRQIVFSGHSQHYSILTPETIGLVARSDLSSLVLQGVKLEHACFATINRKFKSLRTLALDTFVCDFCEASDLELCASRSKILLRAGARVTQESAFVINYLAKRYSENVALTNRFETLKYDPLYQ